ncbi:MAG: autotransporter-associated beta strand repeat-containing protein [Verrucomicrobiota bacterium]
MKTSPSPSLDCAGAFAARVLASSLAACIPPGHALAQNTAISNTSATGAIGTATHWLPASVPTISNDAVFNNSSGKGIRNFNSGTLTFGSLDVTVTSVGTYTIRNENISAITSSLVLGGPGNMGNGVSGANVDDLIYVSSIATLKLTATGGTNGIGVFGIVLGQSGNFNIAGTCEISSIISDGGNHHGFTKTGAGKLTLSGVNTYSGNTTVSGGTLDLADNAGLRFAITDSANNKVAGSGIVTLNGDFTIDTTAVTVSSGSWTLVDCSTLNETFGASFSVAGADWSEHSNVWTKVEGARTWTFTEATGVLALTSTGLTAYDTWAATTYGLSGAEAAFDMDHDHDGIANGLEWILGGDPTRADLAAISPVITGDAANGLTLIFKRAAGSLAETELAVAWGGRPDLLSNIVTIGSADRGPNGNQPTVALDAPAPGQVTVNIPAANASGGRLFARLQAARK